LIYRDVFTRFWPKYGPVLLDYLREESEVQSMFRPEHGKSSKIKSVMGVESEVMPISP